MQVESNIHMKWQRVPPTNLTVDHWNSYNNYSNTSNLSNMTADLDIGRDGLPLDPRNWSSEFVYHWIISASANEGIDGSLVAEKFKMNGKALCLMTLNMFKSRTNPVEQSFGNRVPLGYILYTDFQVRLARALNNNNNIKY